MRKVIVFLVVAGLWVTCANAEDVIYLKSGEVLQGQILAQDTTNEMIQFRFQDGKEFLIRTSDIQNMMSQSNPLGQQPQNYAQQPYFAPPPNYSPNPYYPFQGYGMPQGQSAPPGFGQTAPPYYGQFAPQYFGDAPQNRQTRGVSSVGKVREKTQGNTSFLNSVRLGLRGGINSANVKTSDNSKTNGLTGVSVAAVVEIPVYRRVSFQTEIGFSQYGYSGTLSGNDIKLNYDVVEAQLLGKLKVFHRNNKLNVSLLGGLAPGVRLSAKVSSGNLGLNVNTFTRTLSASGVVGGNFSYRLGKNTELGVDIRYLIGLTNLSSQDVTSRNATTFVGASLIF